MTKPGVLVIGAGVGGLSLAQGLKKARVPFHVYESDLEEDFPEDTYRMRIDKDGAAALQDVLTPELWAEFERTCALTEPNTATINALNGIATPIKQSHQLNVKPYAADRAVLLRNVLKRGLNRNISFGKRCTGYRVTSSGIAAKFSDGTTVKGTLLVGADGAKSQIRGQLLPNHRPYDTQGCCIYGRTEITRELLQHVSPHAIHGMTICHDNTHEPPLTLITEPTCFKWNISTSELPQDHVSWILQFPKKPNSREDISQLSRWEVAKATVRMVQDWDRSIRILLDLQDPSQTGALQIMTTKPELPSWPASAPVTLLGDAIHVMSPIGTSGVNLTLRDAATLAASLAGGISAEAIGRYEERMREYVGKALQASSVDARCLLQSTGLR